MYAATKNAVRTFSEGLRQEAGADLRVTVVSPGVTRTEFTDPKAPEMKARILDSMGEIAMPPEAVARAVAYASDGPPRTNVLRF